MDSNKNISEKFIDYLKTSDKNANPFKSNSI